MSCHYLVARTGGCSDNMAVSDPRNHTPQAEDAICRFMSKYTKDMEGAKLSVALAMAMFCPVRWTAK